jgi:hypothetical protein
MPPAARYAHPAYRKARQGWLVRVAQGNVVCHLCGRLTDPAGGFDLDHVRGKGGALHPAHIVCNRSEGAAWRGRRRLAWGSASQDSKPVYRE